MAEFLGNKTISSQFLGNKVILRTYKGDNLINEYEPLYNPPSDWSDIRTDCPENSIALYVAHPSDFSAYDNFGFSVGIVDGYKVFIDGLQYGTTYQNGVSFSITWSTSGILTGDDITTPSAMKAHKIWVVPATLGDNFYSFRSNRVASSGTEEQGLLWTHFNFKNNITLNKGFSSGDSWTYFNKILQAVTAKNNIISLSTGTFSISAAFYNCEKLEYLPVINGNNGTFSSYEIFCNCKSLKKLVFKNLSFEGSTNICTNCYNLEEFKYNGSDMQANPQAFTNCYKLNKTPAIAKNGDTNSLNEFITNASSLEDTIFDFSGYDNVTLLRCYGSISNFMTGFKGLRVSSSAPFNYQYGPQIDVSYTGMDRAALVQLFNDLPYNVGYTVVGSPTITDGIISQYDGSNYVKVVGTIGNSKDWEIVTKVKLGSLGSWTYAINKSGHVPNGNWMIGTSLNNIRFIAGEAGAWACDFTSASAFAAGDIVFIKIKYQSSTSTFTMYSSSDGVTWTQEGQGVNTNYVEGNTEIGFGRYYNATETFDFIDLNNTYIKINDVVYWFRGQPAMTKRLSCVGCTGTADLTADDRAIVTDKGWAITYQ